jgi:hypothetical protein
MIPRPGCSQGYLVNLKTGQIISVGQILTLRGARTVDALPARPQGSGRTREGDQ